MILEFSAARRGRQAHVSLTRGLAINWKQSRTIVDSEEAAVALCLACEDYRSTHASTLFWPCAPCVEMQRFSVRRFNSVYLARKCTKIRNNLNI